MSLLKDKDPIWCRASIEEGQLYIDNFHYARLTHQILGSTPKSLVVSAQTIDTSRLIAVKTINPKGTENLLNYRHQLLKEHQLLAALYGHPHILELIGTCLEETGIPALITANAGMTLAKIISERAKNNVWGISKSESAAIADAGSSALNAIHQLGVVGCDLKFDNIFVDNPSSLDNITSANVRIGDIAGKDGVHNHCNDQFYPNWKNPNPVDDHKALKGVIYIASNPRATVSEMRHAVGI